MKRYRLIIFLVVSVLVHTAWGAAAEVVPQKKMPTDAERTCELIFRGLEVDFVNVQSKDHSDANSTKYYHFYSPDEVIELPPGKYRIVYIQLKKGPTIYSCEEFELTPEKPYVLCMEGITSEIVASRAGPFLCVSSKGPRDNKDHGYHDDMDCKWLVRIQHDGKEVDSGCLEYG